MDLIVKEFSKHVTTDELCHYRQTFLNSLAHYCRGFFLFGWRAEDAFVSGSSLEGTFLARLFDADEDSAESSSKEFEMDFMVPMIRLENMAACYTLHYSDVSPVHVHILLDADRIRELNPDAPIGALQKMSIIPNGQLFLNISFLRRGMMETGYKVLEVFERMADVDLSSSRFDCHTGSAPVTLEIGFGTKVNDQRRELAVTSGQGRAQTRETNNDVELIYSRLQHSAVRRPEASSRRDKMSQIFATTVRRAKRYFSRCGKMIKETLYLEQEFAKRMQQSPLCHQVECATRLAYHGLEVCKLAAETFSGTFIWSFVETTGIWFDNPDVEMLRACPRYCDYIARFESAMDSLDEEDTRNRIRKLLRHMLTADVGQHRLTTILEHVMSWCEIYTDAGQLLNANANLIERLASFGETWVDKLSIDFVPCLHLDSWPAVAQGWIHRNRIWPEQAVVDKIVSRGIHLVQKPMCHQEIDFRLSFSVAEVDLADHWTDWQRYIAFIFKSLFYKFIKCVEVDYFKCQRPAETADKNPKKYLTSYLIKTVVMHTSEKFPQSWWNEENAGECLTVLLFALQSALDSRSLEHYFVSALNLLKDIPEELSDAAASAIQQILGDPSSAVSQLEPHFVALESTVAIANDQLSSGEILTQLAKFLISHLHKRSVIGPFSGNSV